MNFKQMTFVCMGLLYSLGAAADLLDSTKVYPIQEVTVHASHMERKLKDLPQKVEIISQSLIKSLPCENLAEVLKRTTNLDIIQYPGLSAAVGMRGFSPSAHSRSYTLLLIDGKPAGTTNLATIDLNNVEQIEIVKGSYSVLYGSDAMGGVVNIITKKGGAIPEVYVSVESGSFGYRKFSGNFTGNSGTKLTYGLGYSRQEQTKDYRIGQKNLLKISDVDKLILDKASYGDAMDNSQYEMNSANAFVNYDISKQWKISAEGAYTFAYDVETAGNYWGTYGQSKKDVNRLNLYVTLEQNNAKNHFRFSPYYTDDQNPNYSDNTDDGFISFTSTVKESGYQLQDNYKLGNFDVLLGTDLKVYDYQSNRFSSIGTPADPYKPNNKFTNVAAFTQLAYSVKNLNLNAGVRYDHFTYHIDANDGLKAPEANADYNTVNPSVGAQYQFLKNFKAHSSFGTAFSVPDAFKVAGKYTVSGKSYVGNPDLDPEKSRTTDFGIGYSSAKNSLRLDVSYFQTLHDHKIVEEKLASGEYTYANANKSTMKGIEAMLSYNLGQFLPEKPELEVYANFTWILKNDFTQLVGTEMLTRDMQYVRKANGNFGLNYRHDKINMRLNGRFIGSRLEKDSFSSIRTGITSADYYTKGGYVASDKVLQHPEYLLFDYSIGYAFSEKVNFGITISNLLDENYSEKDGYNMPGRSIVAKLGYSF
ncbi:TonB-dependent receptor [Aquipluma nitroreducens]|uniref:TonB-dependent receptor n=1 Tax=Aquipluma nitroreducens TaxID=2010828 RepID=A0A5K7SA25_9BACT|nr:TonB-dependent receptor [Aquipluma nitroreducens]BBE18297.1 TonB-dependent receptor [Aquipluma nitroreducens]